MLKTKSIKIANKYKIKKILKLNKFKTEATKTVAKYKAINIKAMERISLQILNYNLIIIWYIIS